MSIDLKRVVIQLSSGSYRLIDPAEIFYLEAAHDETAIRQQASRRLHDARTLGTLIKKFEAHGFLRIHRNHAVNLRHIVELRRRGRDWEVRLDAPVNKILPVGRSYLTTLRKILLAEES